MVHSGTAFRPRIFLVVTWALNVCINAFYISPAAVFPQLIPDLGISKAQAGGLISFYLLAILLSQIPAGYVIDRMDPRKIIALAALAVVGLSIPMALVDSYGPLLVLRILAGLPVAFVFVPSAFLVSRAFERTPGRAVGAFLSAPPAGVALGNLLSPLVADAFGWSAVLVAFTLPLLPILPAFLRASRDLPARDPASFPLREFFQAFRNRELWKIGLVFACSYAAYIFFSSWSPTYLKETGSVGVAILALASASVPAAGILSRPLGGYLAETRFAKDKRSVPFIAFGILLVVSVAVPLAPAFAPALFVAAGFLAQFPFSVYYLFSSQVMPRRFGGTAFAFMNTTSLIGGSVSPALAGFLVDVTGTFASAFAMMAVNALLGLALLAFVRER